MYKIHIDNRKYTEWLCLDVTTLKQVDIEWFNPLEHKIMSNDLI